MLIGRWSKLDWLLLHSIFCADKVSLGWRRRISYKLDDFIVQVEYCSSTTLQAYEWETMNDEPWAQRKRC